MKGSTKKRAVRDPVVVQIDPSLCKACGICVALCPVSVLDAGVGGLPVVSRPGECTSCRVCELHCPDFAITVIATRTSERVTVSEEVR